MSGSPYRVWVVLDKEFGSRLSELPEREPVWIRHSPINRAASEIVWADHPTASDLEGVTVFKSKDNSVAEVALINEIYMIDLHHGEYSADPPYTVLEIIGTPITPRIESELAKYGFAEFETTLEGFKAIRPLSESGP